jgi:hypothetical protein
MRMIQYFNYLAAQLDMAKEAVPTKSYLPLAAPFTATTSK